MKRSELRAVRRVVMALWFAGLFGPIVGAEGVAHAGQSYVQAELTENNGAPDDWFGYSVAISGNTVLVGASEKTVGANTNQGAAYVFTINGSKWVQQAELTANDGGWKDHFGTAVAILGNIAVIGASARTVGANSGQGAAYVFEFNGSSWYSKPN